MLYIDLTCLLFLFFSQPKISLHLAKCSYLSDGRRTGSQCVGHDSKGPKSPGRKAGQCHFLLFLPGFASHYKHPGVKEQHAWKPLVFVAGDLAHSTRCLAIFRRCCPGSCSSNRGSQDFCSFSF